MTGEHWLALLVYVVAGVCYFAARCAVLGLNSDRPFYGAVVVRAIFWPLAVAWDLWREWRRR